MSLTSDVSSDELRKMAESMQTSDDILVWLEGERNLEAAKRKEAFAVEDKVAANRHDDRVRRLAQTINELVQSRTRLAAFQETLANRIIIALKEARLPAWQATHRHYKGTLYRVTGVRMDANGEELVEGIEYDDAAGSKYYLHRTRWEGTLESGKLRYQPLVV